MTSPDVMTWRDMLAFATHELGDPVVARWVCEHASGAGGRDEFESMRDELVTQGCGRHVVLMCERIVAGEPVQYVMGRWAFRHLDVMVDRRVLIPRPDTECLVDVALAHLAQMRHREPARPAVVVDLGTGSGVVGLSIVDESPQGAVSMWLTDIDADALDVARANIAGLGRAAAGTRVVMGSWCDALPSELRHEVDLIVSNPPYVCVDDPDLAPAVAEWEPARALFAGPDGLDDLRHIISVAPTWLRPGGVLAVEMGSRQNDDVVSLFVDNGFVDVTTHHDAAGHQRVVSGRRQ